MDDSQHFMLLFQNALNISEDIRLQASAEILADITNNRLHFILTCASFLKLAAQIDEIILGQTIVFLSQSLSPSDVQIINEIWAQFIQQKRDQGVDIANDIKQSVINLFSHPNQAIRNCAATCLSNISFFDRGLYQSTFSQLVDLFNDNEKPPEVRITALISLKTTLEYYSNPNKYQFSEFNASERYKEVFSRLNSSFLPILANFRQQDLEFLSLIYEIIAILARFKSSKETFLITPFFDEDVQSNQEFIGNLFAITQEIVSAQPQNLHVYQSIHSFLLSFSLVLYDELSDSKYFSGEKEERYEAEVAARFVNFIYPLNYHLISPPQPYTFIALDFWDQIGTFEVERFRQIDMANKYEAIINSYSIDESDAYKSFFVRPPLLNFLTRSSEHLLPLLFQSLSVIDDAFVNCTDPYSSLNEISNSAIPIIQKFFILDPQTTFGCLTCFFEQIASLTNWQARYAQLLSVICICDECDSYPFVLQFLTSIAPMMLTTLDSYKESPLIVEVTLSAFLAAFQTYHVYLDLENGVNPLIALITLHCQSQSTEAIIERSIQVLTEIVTSCDPNNPESPITSILQSLMNFISMLYNRPDFAQSYYTNAFYILKEAIVNHVHHETQLEFISNYLTQANKLLDTIPNELVQAGEIHVIAAIVSRFAQELKENALVIADKLVHKLNSQATSITEECLSSFITVITSLGENSVAFLPQLKEQLAIAYQSNSPEIIIRVNQVIGHLFVITNDQMNDILELAITSILQQLQFLNSDAEGSLLFREQINTLLIPLSQILQSISVQELAENVRDRLFAEFCGVLSMYTAEKGPFKDDIDLQNTVLEGVLKGFGAVIIASRWNTAYLRRIKIPLFKFLEPFKRLPYKTDKLLDAFCSFMESAFLVMNNDVVMRNRIRNNQLYALLFLAQCSKNKEVQVRAKNIYQQIVQAVV